MNYNSIIISMILSIIFFDVLGNNKLEMKCTITEELEKNEPAINKNYTEKDILIFMNFQKIIKKSWNQALKLLLKNSEVI